MKINDCLYPLKCNPAQLRSWFRNEILFFLPNLDLGHELEETPVDPTITCRCQPRELHTWEPRLLRMNSEPDIRVSDPELANDFVIWSWKFIRISNRCHHPVPDPLFVSSENCPNHLFEVRLNYFCGIMFLFDSELGGNTSNEAWFCYLSQYRYKPPKCYECPRSKIG